MERFAPGFKTTLRVRLIHALVRYQVQRKPGWDMGALGLPVNQTDMTVTYLGFSVAFLAGQRLLGVPITRHESRDVMHLWRYIGWLSGVEDRWLVDSEGAGRVALYQNLVAQAPPDETSHVLGRALMDEPLRRHYRFQPLSGRFFRAAHLSAGRVLLGRGRMAALGLPTDVLPWFPLLIGPPTALWHGIHRLLPSGRERLSRRGRAAQIKFFRAAYGEKPYEVTPPQSRALQTP